MVTRKSYAGAAVATTLTSGINSTATSIPVASTSGFPNTTIGPFVVTLDKGTTSEEKCLISAYTSTDLTVETRGYDGTTAASHSFGATCVHTIDAVSIQEAHDFASLVGTVTPSTSAVGDAASDGTSTVAAAADHKHGREAFGTSATVSAVGDAEAAGSATTPARSDHLHGRESFGTSASTSAPGDAESAGVATTPSRSDHKHGRETYPVVGNPAGRMVNTAGTTVPSGAVQVTSMSQDYVRGSVTYSSNGLTVPVAGTYRIGAGIYANEQSNGTVTGGVGVLIYKNGSKIAQDLSYFYSQFAAVLTSVEQDLAADDVLTLYCLNVSGSQIFCDPTNGVLLPCFLTVSLVSS